MHILAGEVTLCFNRFDDLKNEFKVSDSKKSNSIKLSY